MKPAHLLQLARAHARRALASRRLHDAAKVLVLAPLLATGLNAAATTALADSPIFATNSVPGNVALALSVEWPTAVRSAHTTAYAGGTTFLGYFDPNKCYRYEYYATEDLSIERIRHFVPAGVNTGRNCTTDGYWSGNFLNWAASPTIDPFRWAMTGGYRIVDTTTTTILQKARDTGQGLAPNKSLSGSTAIAAATPLSFDNVYTRTQGLQLGMRFTALPANTLNGSYFNNINLSGGAAATRNGQAVNFDGVGDFGDPVEEDNFSVRWTGRHTAPSTGTYTFQTVSKNGVRLYIDNVPIINNWTDHARTTNTATIAFVAGQQYDIRLEYYDRTGSSVIQLFWQPPGATEPLLYSNPLETGPVTAYDPSLTLNRGTVYEVTMRNRVCDSSAAAGGVEANCRQYGSNWKPEGLMQQYSQRLRFSAFGYLNDSDMLRDGGVLRAQQKFVGPMQPVPGQPAVANLAREWDATTGIFVVNPDTTDANQTNTDFAPGTNITNSGVINYLNKFGQLSNNNYKSFDPVSEMYYTALRYYRNLGSVPEYTAMSSASAATRTTYLDGFPAITRWNDPIQYSCQKNFILGIGDIYTHRDKNLPGATGTTEEPTKPSIVASDTDDTAVNAVNAETATNLAFALQGLAAPNVNNYSGRNNSAGMVGLAYWANVNDIRPDTAGQANTVGRQTVQTLWVDVLEQSFQSDNQFYLTAKYGGFTLPRNADGSVNYRFDNTTPLTQSWWSTSGETLTDTRPNPDITQPRPDNYFTAGNPSQMITGLTRAFERINTLSAAFTTSFSTSLPQVSQLDNASFGAQYDPSTWTGEVVASELDFSTDGVPTLTERWRATTTLAAQLAGTGWDTNRRVATWNGSAGVTFRSASLSTAQQAALDTSYRAGDDNADYLNYLRGDRTHEQNSTVTTSSRAYRTRTQLLGDIVGSRARPIGAPALPLSDASNPGYSTFKTDYRNRPTVLYVGANDGMLHAFNGALTGTGAGQEIFAYVPSATFSGPSSPATPSVNGLASLGNPSFTHHYLVNATPTGFDIDFTRTWNGTGVGTGTADWRTVLIGGLGKGGRSYYAIDVTNPATITTEAAAAGRVLWEFTAPEMGYTFGEPVVVKTRKYGWTVIFPSGYNTPDGRGYLFFVDPSNGALLETVTTGVGSTTNDAGLAHANGYVVDFTDGYADAIYGGDLLGNLWRFDVTATAGAYPSPIVLARLTDSSGNAQPITSRPMMELHPRTKKRVVLVGTGRLLDSTDISSTREQTFYAIEDGNQLRFNAAANLPAGVDFPIERNELIANANLLTGFTGTTTSMGWYTDLGRDATSNVGWRVVSDPATFSGTVAFAPTLPSISDPCTPSGTSRIYATDYASGISRLINDSGVVSFITMGSAGVVTDLRFLSVGGRVRLIGGTDRGAVERIRGNFGSAIGLRRLNWRELQIGN